MHATPSWLPKFWLLAAFLGLFARLYGAFKMFSATRNYNSLENPSYGYVGADIPRELPGEYPDVAMVFNKNDTVHYPLDDNDAWASLWPEQLGLVRLGPKGRPLGISMYHQLHCLNSIRYAYMVARLGLVTDLSADTSVLHNTHCFHFIRQSIMCHADMTLVQTGDPEGTEKMRGRVDEEIHRCKDWTKIRAFAEANQREWKGVPLMGAWDDMDTV